MNRKKYIALTLALSLFCTPKTYAACTQEEINEFKKIEDDYKVTYEFNNDTKDYTVTFKTVITEKYGIVPESNITSKKFVTYTENSFTFSGVTPGTYTIKINGLTETCNGTLKTITLDLPKYNSYSEDPLCEGIEEFVLCQPTYDKEIDYETFVSRVNTYKKTKEEKKEIPKQEEKENKLLEYIENNLLEIIIILAFIILVTITTIITAKSIRKSRRLE